MPDPVIITAIPYAEDMNLGGAYNTFFEMLPEDAWGCILDHDVMFTTPYWHRQLTAAVLKEPEGSFGGMASRIKCPYQLLDGGLHIKNHDIKYHRAIGEKLRLAKGDSLLDVTGFSRTPSGFLILLSKKTWRAIGGFPHGLHLLDKTIWMSVFRMGRRIFIIEGLYLYHWHRGNQEAYMEGPWVLHHTLPDGQEINRKPGTFQ